MSYSTTNVRHTLPRVVGGRVLVVYNLQLFLLDRAGPHALGMPPKRTPAATRFWRHVDKTESCWNWSGFIRPNGYATFKPDGGRGTPNMYAHRFSYLLHFGELPVEAYVCHRCDNRRCVRPDHLFIGTHQQNQEDMARKGRHGFSKLSPDEVREIRVAIAAGERGVSVARRFGVTKSIVSRLARGLTYVWVDQAA